MKIYLDNSGRALLDFCERKFFLQRILNLEPKRGSNALRYGKVWHALLEGYYSSIKDRGWNEFALVRASAYGLRAWEELCEKQSFEDDYRTLDAANESLLEYHSQFFFSDKGMLEVIQTEQIFQIPLEFDPKKFRFLSGNEVIFYGRLDLQVTLNGVPWIVEHKTTSHSAKMQAERLHRSPQTMGYAYAGKHALDFVAEGCLVCIHQISAGKKKDGTYGSVNRKFIRSPQIYTEKDLESWKDSFLSAADRLVYCLERDFLPMRYDSCYSYGRCKYCPLCERNLSIEELRSSSPPEGYVILEDEICQKVRKM